MYYDMSISLKSCFFPFKYLYSDCLGQVCHRTIKYCPPLNGAEETKHLILGYFLQTILEVTQSWTKVP